MNWDSYFLNLVKNVALKSKDSTAVGCVIVGEDNQILSTGWNGFSRGVKETPERMERPAKYDWTIHAEANAICNAARSGVRLKGSKIYVTHMCCKSCSDMIIQAGICEVICDSGAFGAGVGNYNFDASLEKFKEAKVKVTKHG